MEVNTNIGKEPINKLPLTSDKSSKDKKMNRAQTCGDIKKRDKKEDFIKMLQSAQNRDK